MRNGIDNEHVGHTLAHNPAASGTAPIDHDLRDALRLLAQAYRLAHDAGSELWDFALEISRLFDARLTASDLRWLIAKGFVEHGQELSVYGGSHRSSGHSAHPPMIISEFPPVPSRGGQPRCRCGTLARARPGSCRGSRGGLRPVQPGHGGPYRDPRHSPAVRPAIDPGGPRGRRAYARSPTGLAAQLDLSVREVLIGHATKHHRGSTWMRTGQHESELSGKRWVGSAHLA